MCLPRAWCKSSTQTSSREPGPASHTGSRAGRSLGQRHRPSASLPVCPAPRGHLGVQTSPGAQYSNVQSPSRYGVYISAGLPLRLLELCYKRNPVALHGIQVLYSICRKKG